MLISYRNKFIFIHNPKVAGLSLKKALGKYALNSPSKVNWLNIASEYSYVGKLLNFHIFNSLPFLNSLPFHGIASTLKMEIGSVRWDNSFKFGFVRNPWDREVSLYRYILKKKKHYLNKVFAELGSFDAYVEWSSRNPRVSQKRFFYSPDDELLVDFVGKFENIENDFKYVCSKINIRETLPHINMSNRKATYREYYSKKTRNIVAEYCKDEILQFEYEF